jgi:hypothetical protein
MFLSNDVPYETRNAFQNCFSFITEGELYKKFYFYFLFQKISLFLFGF